VRIGSNFWCAWPSVRRPWCVCHWTRCTSRLLFRSRIASEALSHAECAASGRRVARREIIERRPERSEERRGGREGTTQGETAGGQRRGDVTGVQTCLFRSVRSGSNFWCAWPSVRRPWCVCHWTRCTSRLLFRSRIASEALSHAECAASGRRVARREIIETRPERSEEHTSELQSRFDLVCRL